MRGPLSDTYPASKVVCIRAESGADLDLRPQGRYSKIVRASRRQTLEGTGPDSFLEERGVSAEKRGARYPLAIAWLLLASAIVATFAVLTWERGWADRAIVGGQYMLAAIASLRERRTGGARRPDHRP